MINAFKSSSHGVGVNGHDAERRQDVPDFMTAI
jgi:hypothetical protein